MQKILRKRVWRDLRANAFRYLALGMLIALGMYIIVSLIGAAETLMQGLDAQAQEHKLEDGQFSVFVPLKKEETDKLKKLGITLEKQFYLDFQMKDDSVVRVFQTRKKMNLLALDYGRKAKKENEIVLENRYCEEHKIEVGDFIKLAGQSYQVTGRGSTPDYDAPLKNFSDASVDSKMFGTAFVSEAGYRRLKETHKSMRTEEYVYSYRLQNGVSSQKVKDTVRKFTFDAEQVKDSYFQDYWEETGGKKEEITDGIEKLLDGSDQMKNALEKLSGKKELLNQATQMIFETYLNQANDALKEYGCNTLTEDNFEKELNKVKAQSESSVVRLSIGSAIDQLKELKAYRDGVKQYTEGVEKVSGGSKKLYDGMKDLKEGSDELIDTYFTKDASNMTSFVKAKENVRIRAAANDQVINKQAGIAFGVVLIILFTYVISVFVVHGIEKESTVIGALYAMGAGRKDLIIHYLTLPVVVTFVGGVIGLLTGISPIGISTQMQDTYHYFSVPGVSVIVPVYLILYGAVMPPVIALLVNYLVIRRKLSKTALSLMRNETKQPHGSNVNLGKLSFVHKFQIRQMLRETRTGLTVILGMFISLICMMLALDCYVLCVHLNEDSTKDTKYKYMYSYKYPEKKVKSGGEEAYAYSFKKEIFGYNLDVTLLGVNKDNPYFDLSDMKKGQSNVVISSAMAQKYLLHEGDKLIVTDEEEEKDYAFTVMGITEYAPSFYMFMDIDSMRELFGQSDDYFNVVFSDKALDLQKGRLYSTTTKAEIEKSSAVFTQMMMGMVVMITIVSTLIFCVVMYLMVKVMIDRSAFSISLIKVFGFRISEIRRLYLNGNFLTIAVGALICIPASKAVMDAMYPSLLVSNVACGINLSFSWQMYVVLYVGIILFYLLVNRLLVRRLQKTPLTEVLKNRE